jgi:hypothetical protein
MASAHPNLAGSNPAQFDDEPQCFIHRSLIAKGLMDVRIQKKYLPRTAPFSNWRISYSGRNSSVTFPVRFFISSSFIIESALVR